MGRTEAEQTPPTTPIADKNLDRIQDKVQESSCPEMDMDSCNAIDAIPPNIGSKFKEQNGDTAVSPGEQEAEITADESLDSGLCDQKAGIRWETPGFLEDGFKSTTEGINGRRDLWRPSPDRESKLEVVKTGLLYDVRAYKAEQKKPSRLYEEDEGEFVPKLPPENLTPEKAKELEEERRKIIKSQAMRKTTTAAEKWSSEDKPGATSVALPRREKTQTKGSDSSMEFAVCFDKPSSGWVRTVVDPENIDTKQICFAAAQQQFLALEQSDPDLFLGPRRRVMTPRQSESKNVYGSAAQQQGPAVPKGGGLEKAGSGLSIDGRQPQKKSGATLDSEAGGQDCARELEAGGETPIEREIRLSVEREKNFWQERGIQRLDSREELVEIRPKPLLSSSHSASVISRKRKDKACVSFCVQREIEQETKREEDLQKEGRLLGAYDKGPLQEVGELRKVFEQEGTLPPSAQKLEHPERVQEATPAEWSAEVRFASGQEKARLLQDMNQRTAAAQSCSASDTRLGNEPSQSRQEAVDLDAQAVVQRKEHLAPQMGNSRLTLVQKQGSPRAGRTEGRLKWEAPREELYTLKTGKTRTSLLIDQEIQDALQREEELQEQRRKGRPATSRGTEKSSCSHLPSQSSAALVVDTSSPKSGSPVYAPGSPTRPPASPSRPSESVSKTHHSLMQSPRDEEKRRQREEGKYAGIEPTDEIDAEVVNSTKVVRRRGVRAQLWEAGQILKRGDESDPELPLFDF